MSAAIPKPEPKPEGLNADFFENCARGQLCFQRCDDCQAWRHQPRHLCAACGSAEWSWQASSGRGSIFSWTVTHQSPHPAFAAEAPFAIVVVEMDEGVRMVSRLRGIEPQAIELGQRVEVELERVTDEVALPYVRPLEPSRENP